MATIENTVRYLRSKNAGPFWITIDAFCRNAEDTEKVARTFEKNRQWIADTYGVEAENVLIFSLPDITTAKISFPRRPVEGDRDERDMHGGQVYVSLLDFEVCEE